MAENGRFRAENGQENFLYGLSLLIFVVLAPLTVMNMIVGVLVEVVGIVAAAEQEASTRKSLLETLKEALLEPL